MHLNYNFYEKILLLSEDKIFFNNFFISIIVVELLLKLVGFRAIIAPEINIKVSTSSIFKA